MLKWLARAISPSLFKFIVLAREARLMHMQLHSHSEVAGVSKILQYHYGKSK